MLTIDGIRAMGLYLLDVLKAEKVARYSDLCEKLQADESPAGGAMQSAFDKGSAHIDLEYAAWQLKDLSIVRIRYTGESLVDTDLYRLCWPGIAEDVLVLCHTCVFGFGLSNPSMKTSSARWSNPKTQV